MTAVLTPATLPAVPSALAKLGIGLHPQDSDSLPFLVHLFIQTRWDELAGSGWPDQQKSAFLTQQFTFTDLHYTQYYPQAARGIITQGAQPIGRLFLDALPGELRIVDIALLPAHRSHGIGTALISAVLEQAWTRGEVITIHVEMFNRARQLYRRLGFVDIGGDEVYRKMELRPSNCRSTESSVS